MLQNIITTRVLLDSDRFYYDVSCYFFPPALTSFPPECSCSDRQFQEYLPVENVVSPVSVNPDDGGKSGENVRKQRIFTQ